MVICLVGGPLATVFLVALLAAGAFAQQVLQVREDMEVAKEQLGVAAAAAVGMDFSGFAQASEEIVERTERARATSSGPLWDLAAEIPQVRNNVLAVRGVTDAVNTITSRSLPPLVEMVSTADAGGAADPGLGIDLRPFLGAGTVLPTVISSLEEASAIATSLDRTGVVPAVSEPVDEMVDLIAMAVPALTLVQEHLPELMHAAGADKPMLYQLMIQTPAEIRATGGGPAHWLVLKVENGRAELVAQENGVDLMYSALPEAGFDTVNGSLIKLQPKVRSLYPFELTNWSSNFTMTPHFPRAVELFHAARKWTGQPQFDGVISIDPIVLAHMLEATGPLTLASGEEVNAQNTGSLLMSEPYERFGADNAAMDAFFSEVTSVMFDALTGGEWEIGPMWDQLVRSAEEGRINLWFEDAGLQSLAHEYGLDGALREDNTEATQLGVYFNDYSVGKLNYWLDFTQRATCNADARTITVSMDLRSRMTDDISSEYTLGLRNGFRGIDERTMMLDVLFFAPPGAEILSTEPERGDWQDGANWQGNRFRDRAGVDHGNTAESKTVLLEMGEERTISYEVQLPEGSLGPLELRHSPGANDTAVTVDANCGALFASPEGSRNIRLSTIG
ncbi:DUF4012 domain-containing protein [Microbacterium ureisolvens]|uniref:DUF4012 domain-containing protein n=1 Tax=Microbacterium ureisolvens TaxID=2781186 RepID=UPI00363C8352